MFYVCKIFCRFCPFYFGKQERQSLQKILQQCKNDLLKKLLNFSVIFNHILDKTFPFCQKRGNFLFCSHRTGCGHRTVPLSLRSYIVEGDSSVSAHCTVYTCACAVSQQRVHQTYSQVLLKGYAFSYFHMQVKT